MKKKKKKNLSKKILEERGEDGAKEPNCDLVGEFTET